MQLLGVEKYGTKDRDFVILIFRDNNNDRLVLLPCEVTKGKIVALHDKESIVPMNGKWDLEPRDYEEYSKELAAVKGSIVILGSTNSKN